MGRSLPSGNLTLLFTDIEGSTQVLRELGDGYGEVLTQHHALIRAAVARHGGHEISTEGDAFFVVFEDADAGVATAVDAQCALADSTGPGRLLRVRMGLHVGPVRLEETGYVGMAVHEAARVAAAGNGGQIVVSGRLADAVSGRWPAGADVVDLGFHRLKDVAEPMRLYRVRPPGVPDDARPVRSLGPGLEGFPHELTTLVGRTDLVDRVAGALRDGCRLVTLVGVGGVGKTRVALEAGRRVAPGLRNGAAFVDLSATRDVGGVLPAIAAVLRLEDVAGGAVDVVNALAGRELLLVLDNLEQIPDVGRAVSDLLAAAGRVQVLTTSRTRLAVAGERVVEVDPLSVDGTGAALELFEDRAADALGGRRFADDEREAAAAVCRRLDGVPLALELAAARLRMFDVAELAARLTERLPLLVDRRGSGPERQRAMAATIRWSHDLLADDERVVFRRLAVFAGGFPVDAAEKVAGAGVDAAPDVVESLLDQSLVHRVAGAGGRGRLRLLETVREYAALLLDEHGEREAVEARHAEHFIALAAEAGSALAGPDRQASLARFDDEGDNLRAALDRAVRRHDCAALEITAGLAWWWYHRGRLDEGLSCMLAALRLDCGDSRARVESLVGAARLARYLERTDEANDLADAAVDAARRLGDERLLGTALYVLGLARERRQDRTAVDAARRGVELLRRAGTAWDQAMALFYAGTFATVLGCGGDPVPEIEEARSLFGALGDDWGVGGTSFYLGLIAHRRGDAVAARRLIEESISCFRAVGDRWRQASALDGLAGVLEATGEDGSMHRDEAVALRRQLGVG